MNLVTTNPGRVRARRLPRMGGPRVNPIDPTTVILVGDTHYGTENALNGNPNDRQVAAINAISSANHPLGGKVGPIKAVIQLGDAVHEANESTARFEADYKLDGTGNIHYPCYVLDGNHDRAQVRTLITARHGSLTWGARIGRVWFQAMTENYTDENTNYPPSAAMIEGDVTDSLAANETNGQPVFLLVHRSMSTAGYRAEWDNYVSEGDQGDALVALDTLASAYRTWGIIHGHDHYSHHTTWNGHKTISPGSVMQNKAAQVGGETDPADFTTVFPESFVVMRIYPAHYDIASYVFGYGISNNQLYWRPDTWEWAETVTP